VVAVIDCMSMLGSPIQIFVVLLVVLIVFGPHRMPEFARHLGEALRDLMRFRRDLLVISLSLGSIRSARPVERSRKRARR
jgi:TatA/E family protein of Tat protein translocase